MPIGDGLLIDVSDYDMDTWDPPGFAAAGVTRAITNSFRKANAASRILTLREAGIEVIGVYGFCYFGPDPHYVNRDVDAAIELAKQFDIPMVWVDAELDARGITGLDHLRASNPAERREQLRHSLKKVEASGLLAGIYTAGWWWPPNMDNTTEFSAYPLWHAEYGVNDGLFPPVTRVSYGGWTDVAIHQYTSTKLLCGRGRDHNYEFALPGVRVQEAEDMAAIEALQREIEALGQRVAEIERRTGGNGERANNVDLLLYADNLNTALLAAIAAIEELRAAVPAETRGVSDEALKDAVARLNDISDQINRNVR